MQVCEGRRWVRAWVCCTVGHAAADENSPHACPPARPQRLPARPPTYLVLAADGRAERGGGGAGVQHAGLYLINVPHQDLRYQGGTRGAGKWQEGVSGWLGRRARRRPAWAGPGCAALAVPPSHSTHCAVLVECIGAAAARRAAGVGVPPPRLLLLLARECRLLCHARRHAGGIPILKPLLRAGAEAWRHE